MVATTRTYNTLFDSLLTPISDLQRILFNRKPHYLHIVPMRNKRDWPTITLTDPVTSRIRLAVHWRLASGWLGTVNIQVGRRWWTSYHSKRIKGHFFDKSSHQYYRRPTRRATKSSLATATAVRSAFRHMRFASEVSDMSVVSIVPVLDRSERHRYPITDFLHYYSNFDTCPSGPTRIPVPVP